MTAIVYRHFSVSYQYEPSESTLTLCSK